ncbi:MAG: formylglycine-generating enzyme family protein, partial [Phycisphaerales bacterium]
YVYRLDEERGAPLPGGTDAVTRPSKPYLPPDRGFGHEGYAAITMSYKNAAEFCVWLSAHSGRKYRLPTEQEWEHAAGGGSAQGTPAGDVLAVAWVAENSDGSPHPVAMKPANGFGLFDMLGNVAEWCSTPDSKGALRGGSYRDAAAAVSPALRAPASRDWNASDPQIPKSAWWLADGPFVGFRVVCEDGPLSSEAKINAPAASAGPPKARP